MNTATAKALIPAKFTLEIPAGDYYIVPTAEMTAESIDWPLDYFGDETGPVSFEDGTVLDRTTFDRYSAILDDAQFSGVSHGFPYGISLRRADEIDADALAFLLSRKAIAAHTVAEDSILVFADEVEARDEIGIPEEASFVLISDAGILDVYLPLQSL